MTEFGDFAFATKLRDLTRSIARAEIDAAIPPDQFGQITDVNETMRRAYVVMPGSVEPQSVGYGFGDAPDTGTTVRVTGRAGSRYIAGAGTAATVTETDDGTSTGVGISGLDVASALDGTELVPIVQDGVTVRTTTQDIADLAGGSASFPITAVDVGFATTTIDHAHIAGGGTDVTTLTSSIVDTSGSPKPEWVSAASVTDGPGSVGAQFLTQFYNRVSTTGPFHSAALNLLATSGADADQVSAELRLEPYTFLGFDIAPYPHVALEAGNDVSGSPAFGRILIESAAFGPVEIHIGGGQDDLIGFFNTTPIVQPAHPSNITDVINLLTDLGLCA